MNSIKQALMLVKSAMEALDGELSSSPDPKLVGVPKVQKEAFKKNLQEIYETLSSGCLPEKSQRNFGLSRAVADSWPFDSELAEKIVKAERAFMEVK